MVMHIFMHCFYLFVSIPFFDELIAFFYKFEIIKDTLVCKIAIITTTLIGSLGARTVRESNLKKIIIILIISSLIFSISHIIVKPSSLYIIGTLAAYIIFLASAHLLGAYIGIGNSALGQENTIEVNFMQQKKLVSNDDSINIPTKFIFNKKTHNGWINVVNPFRASLVLGLPGSGKSFSIFNHYIQQSFEKGYSMFCYDYKYPDLSKIVYNVLKQNTSSYKHHPKMFIINLDDATKTNRCNPLNPNFLTEIMDAYEAAYMIMINLNRTWVQKQGDFFVESAIVFLTAIIWYLKLYDKGKYCTLPHAIELLMQPYEAVFTMLKKEEDIKNYLAPFINAMEGNAQEQLQGQLASVQVPITRLSSPSVYWALSGDDFTLDINNPEEPKIICMANNPDRQTIYAAALSLYITRLFKIINKPHKMKCMVLLDELPTIYIKGLDNLIATARSNKVAIVAGAQDQSQIIRDYGDKEADVIINTIGNIFAGQVKGKTAEMLAKTFGKIHVEKQTFSLHTRNRNDNINFSKQLEEMIPASVISTLSQGCFVGQVADNHNQKIKQKFFYAEVIPNNKIISLAHTYKDIPQLANCENGEMEEMVRNNYLAIKADIENIIGPYL